MSNIKNAWLSSRIGVLAVLTVMISGLAIAEQPENIQVFTKKDVQAHAGWVGTELDLVVDLSEENPTYTGTLTLVLENETSLGPILMLNNKDRSMRLTSLDLVNPQDLPGYTIDKVAPESDGDRKRDFTRIKFGQPVKKGTKIEVRFSYEFFAEQGQVFSRPSKGQENWTPLRYASWVTGWYPYPISDNDSYISLRALSTPGTTKFLLLGDWNALSNGKLIEDKVVGDLKHQTWRSGEGIARSYIAAPYVVSAIDVGGTDVAMYMLNPDKSVVEEKAKLLVEIISNLEDKFGDYPFDTFAVAEVPDFTTDYFTASSEQGFIVSETNTFVNDYGLSVFSHEAGHSWWGNRFNCEGPGQSLCSEALAQIGAVLLTEVVQGKQAARDFLEVADLGPGRYQSARGYFYLWRLGADQPLSEIEGGWAIHRLMDSKGMWFWQMLREEVGDEKFFDTLRSLSDGELNLSLVELQDYFSSYTEIDLEYFFDQWLNRTGAPIIDMEWQTLNAVSENPYVIGEFETILFNKDTGKKKLEITLMQEQEGIYELKPEIEITFYRKPPIRKALEYSEKKQTFTFKFDGLVKDVVLDPDHKILMWRPAYGPKPGKNIEPMAPLEDR